MGHPPFHCPYLATENLYRNVNNGDNDKISIVQQKFFIVCHLDQNAPII